MRRVLFLPIAAMTGVGTLLVIGCGDSTTSPPSDAASLRGNVILESGLAAVQATVRLYAAPQDEQLTQVLSDYPSVGISPYAQLFYNPLTQVVIASAVADESGDFQFDDLADGSYVVDAELLGYACPQPAFVTLQGSLNIGSLQVAQIQPLNEDLSSSTWHSGEVYEIMGNITVLPTAVLNIEQGVLVLIGGDFELKVSGTLNVAGLPTNPVRFRPAVGDSLQMDEWSGLRIEYSSGLSSIEGAAIQKASNAIRIKGSDVQISECLIGDAEVYGIIYEGASEGSTTHCILRNCGYGLMASNSNPAFTNNVILGISGTGIEAKNGTQADISNNAIVNCQTGLWSDWDTAPLIEYNLFSGGIHAVSAQNGFWATLQYNEFQDQTGECIYFNVGDCYPSIQNNNFRNMPQTILYVNGNIGQQADTVYAQYNYWDGEDAEGIPERIIDGHDIGSPNNPIGPVEFQPFRLQPVSGAGP